MIQSTQQLSRIKFAPFDTEPPLDLKMMEEFSSVDVRQNEIQLLWGLEGEFEGHNKGRGDLSEDGPLCWMGPRVRGNRRGAEIRMMSSPARVCVTSERERIWALRIVLRA